MWREDGRCSEHWRASQRTRTHGDPVCRLVYPLCSPRRTASSPRPFLSRIIRLLCIYLCTHVSEFRLVTPELQQRQHVCVRACCAGGGAAVRGRPSKNSATTFRPYIIMCSHRRVRSSRGAERSACRLNVVVSGGARGFCRRRSKEICCWSGRPAVVVLRRASK